MEMEGNHNKRRRIFLLILAVTAAAFIAGLGLRHLNNRPLAFERSHWLQAREEEDWPVRSRMTRDLLTRNLLIGQNRNQLVELLGEPENYPDATGRQLYYLIREDWDWIDPIRRDHLLITLDHAGRVIDARIEVFQRQRR